MVASGVAEGWRGWAGIHNPRSQTDKETEAQRRPVICPICLGDRVKPLQPDSRGCWCPAHLGYLRTRTLGLTLFLALGLRAETRHRFGLQAAQASVFCSAKRISLLIGGCGSVRGLLSQVAPGRLPQGGVPQLPPPTWLAQGWGGEFQSVLGPVLLPLLPGKRF